MIPRVREAYLKAAEAIGADAIVPAPDAMCKLYDMIGENAYRDFDVEATEEEVLPTPKPAREAVLENGFTVR